MKLLSIVAGLVCVLASASTARAQFLTVDFSVTDSFTGDVVTGELTGLADGATGTPSDVIIESYTGIPGLTPLDFDVIGGDTSIAGTVTITDGVVTGVDNLIASADVGADSIQLNNDFGGNVTVNQVKAAELASFFEVDGPSGFSGATYTIASVPEPSTYALLFGGLGLLAIWQRRRTVRR